MVIVYASAAQQCKCEKDKICLLFFHLFLLAVEPLAIKIRQEDKMPGVKLATQRHKLELYVDEVVPTVNQLEDSLALLMDICNNKTELR